MPKQEKRKRKENPFAGEGFLLDRPQYRGRDGQQHQSRHWQIRFKDHRSCWRKMTGYTDRMATVKFARKIRKLVDCRANGEQPDLDLAQWVEDLPDPTRERLIGFDLLDLRAALASQSLQQHLDEWRESIINDGRTENHADTVRTHAGRIVQACGFARYSDIEPETIKAYLAKRQRQDKLDRESGNYDPRRGFSIETRNSHVLAIKQFCKWMVTERRAVESRVVVLHKLNVETDRRRVRRALSTDEIEVLLTTTNSGPSRGRTTGPERATAYWLASETGLRSGEIRSLTANSFDLDIDPPTVTVEAVNSKRRRRDTLAFTSDLAARLRIQLRNKLPTAPAFNLPKRTADMLKDDLRRAGIEYIDSETAEYFDFHSLRVQHATDLARGGASVAVAQARMRHSDPKLTMNIYTRLGKDGQTAALAALPKRSLSAG